MKLAIVGCLLLGCLALSAQPSKAVRYRCPGGEEFAVDYRQGRKPRATVYMTGKPRLELPLVRSASGARYSDGYTTLWDKGGEALLEAGSINVTGCTDGRTPVGNTSSQSSGASVSLDGNWLLTEMNGNAVDASRPPTMQFLPEGNRVAGFAGCNRYNSAYVRQGDSLRFQGAISTKMACIEPGMSLENEFLKALENIAGYSRSESVLELKDTEGKVLLRFRPE